MTTQPPATRMLQAQLGLRSATEAVMRAAEQTARTGDHMPLFEADMALQAAQTELIDATFAVMEARRVR